MRILQIRFKNLNSLVGTWEIDLTHPAFAADGIFAITGPTGAGKTTILDALCLALYGRTPRLSKVTKSGNETMSRQTGECFAEVAFETCGGRFRCHWSQHRARKRPGGELQAPKHEISDADTGKIFESKIKGVADQIISATGMDFERFTRSMLLAQGSFAAFLQASPDERAPILEQITGTELYSRISIHVHERRAEERRQLELLQAELSGIRLLSAEEEGELARQLEFREQEDAELAGQLARNRQEVSWSEGMDRLEQELAALSREQSELRVRSEDFAPQRERLAAAVRALELAADHAALEAARNELDAGQALLKACRNELPVVAEAAVLAEKAREQALERLSDQKKCLQEAQPIIRQTRELDLAVLGKEEAAVEARKVFSEQESALRTLEKSREGDAEQLSAKRREHAELQALLSASGADQALTEHLGGLRYRFDELEQLSGQLAGGQAESARLEISCRAAGKNWQEQSMLRERELKELEVIREKMAGEQSALAALLGERDAAAWRVHQAHLTERKELIARASAAAEALNRSRQDSDRLRQRQTEAEQEAAILEGRLAALADRQARLEQAADLLETQLLLLKRIEDFEEARRHLRDGEPCPLCGSADHPYARGNIPAPNETRRELDTARGELKVLAKETAERSIRRGELHKERERISADLDARRENIETASGTVRLCCAELDCDLGQAAAEPRLPHELLRLKEDNSFELERVAAVLAEVDSCERKLGTLRDSLDRAREAAAGRERAVLQAAHAKATAEQEFERMAGEVRTGKMRLDEALAALRKELEPYGAEELTIEALEPAYARLSDRRDMRVSRERQLREIEKSITTLEFRLHHLGEQLVKAGSDAARQQAILERVLQERDLLRTRRRELFGDQECDQEEQRLGEAVESAERVLDAVRQEAAEAGQALNQLKARIEELEGVVSSRKLQIGEAGAAFSLRMQASGFADEDHYRYSCLPEAERSVLNRRAQELADAKLEAEAREREKTLLLESERRKHLTDVPMAELMSAAAALAEAQRAVRQEIGGLRQKLGDNDRLKSRQQERLEAIDAREREWARWDRLHAIIGSSDGKKFRNFAQGLTFELMIGHANRQLQLMTERYLLVRDQAQPLDLNVIDNYQAGEIRSTKNLSGGESFIVSLALALGLSHMASRNVRVDSLFLDEGFGTLDEEALDTALETLAALQQDGKLIGVISHVPALKERIGTQIQITPQTGGRSTVSGPGCRSISETA